MIYYEYMNKTWRLRNEYPPHVVLVIMFVERSILLVPLSLDKRGNLSIARGPTCLVLGSYLTRTILLTVKGIFYFTYGLLSFFPAIRIRRDCSSSFVPVESVDLDKRIKVTVLRLANFQNDLF